MRPSPHSGKAEDERVVMVCCAAGLYYINAYGSEIHPSPNPDFLTNIALNDVLVYSCGSLWTRCALVR